MKLKQFIEKLKDIQKTYGDELECVYAIDAEGNSFHKVFYLPEVGYFSNNTFDTRMPINSVCVN